MLSHRLTVSRETGTGPQHTAPAYYSRSFRLSRARGQLGDVGNFPWVRCGLQSMNDSVGKRSHYCTIVGLDQGRKRSVKRNELLGQFFMRA